MSLEDGHVLGLCLARLTSKDPTEKKKALAIYEECRRSRTERIVQRGNMQQHLYHVHDGPEQKKRDELLRAFGARDSEGAPSSTVELKDGKDPLPWRWGGVGEWLLTYDCAKDVEEHWTAQGAVKGASNDIVNERAHL
jgi:salicylate hydroxylase